jgi:uncharacterized membrane protein
MVARLFVISVLLSSMMGMTPLSGQQVSAVADIDLYTTNTKISIPPGEEVDYNIDVTNNGDETAFCNLSVTGVPSTWEYTLTSGAYNIKQIALKPGDSKRISLHLEAPLNANKGNYRITVRAGGAQLPLVINISKQGSYATEFTTDQANMEGHAKSPFSFRTKLKNRTGEKQLYSLRSKAPRGWQVTFKPNYQQATSIEIEANTLTDISIEVKPPQNVSAGTYTIPVSALTSLTSSDLELEVVITGTYDLSMQTPRGLVSTKITAGGEKQVDLLVRNTGSAPLIDVSLIGSIPSGWEISFDPAIIGILEPGQQVGVLATLRADKDAIAGDYAANMIARVPEASSTLAFRVAVKTPLLWGWIGIAIIIGALGTIFLLFRKYGRR